MGPLGTVNGLFCAAIFALVGGVLKTSNQSSDFSLVTQVVTGDGTRAMNCIAPIMISEMPTADHRGGFLGCVFIANFRYSNVWSYNVRLRHTQI